MMRAGRSGPAQPSPTRRSAATPRHSPSRRWESGTTFGFIAAEDVVGYVEAVEEVLESFETRDAYLEDVPVADTVLVLQALAGRRGMAAELDSELLP